MTGNQHDYGRAAGEKLENPTCTGVPNSPGPFGQGCHGAFGGYGGGGGGGYFGGGGGGTFGGGGGGSSYSLHGVQDTGYNLGNGYAVLKWDWVGPSFAPSSLPTFLPGPTRKPSFSPTSTAGPTTYPTATPTHAPSARPTALVVSPFKLQFTGDAQMFVVPRNVTNLSATLYGGSGGLYIEDVDRLAIPGRGAMIASIISVTPEEVLMIMVGSAGQANQGGFNGGGKGGGGGGGATDIRRSPYTLSDRILIAGGGGGVGAVNGGSSTTFGGDGGVEATK